MADPDAQSPVIHTAAPSVEMNPQPSYSPCVRPVMAKSACEAILFHPMLSLKILLIDDHSLFRTGLRTLICNGLQDVSALEAAS